MKLLVEVYKGVCTALAILSGILISAMTLAIGAEALLRWTGLGLFRGVIDLSEHALFCIAILTAPWLLLRNGHLVVNVLISNLGLTTQAVLQWFVDLVSLCACLIIFIVSCRVLAVSFRSGQMIFQDIVIPDYWLQWQIPLSMLLLCIAIAGRLARPFLPVSFISKKGYSHA